MLIEKLEGEGFLLLNSSSLLTYIGHNGKSAIDVSLINSPRKGKLDRSGMRNTLHYGNIYRWRSNCKVNGE